MSEEADRKGFQPAAANHDSDGEAIWDTAWAWVRREHERRQFDDAARRDLHTWLEADPTHRAAYAKAGKLWLLTGLVPPANDVPIPGFDDTDPR